MVIPALQKRKWRLERPRDLFSKQAAELGCTRGLATPTPGLFPLPRRAWRGEPEWNLPPSSDRAPLCCDPEG